MYQSKYSRFNRVDYNMTFVMVECLGYTNINFMFEKRTKRNKLHQVHLYTYCQKIYRRRLTLVVLINHIINDI